MPKDQPSPSKYILACKPCRSLKVRCVREDSDGAEAPCSRCARLSLQCVPQSATRRGRPSSKRMNGVSARGSQSPAASMATPSQATMRQNKPVRDGVVDSLLLLGTSLTSPSLPITASSRPQNMGPPSSNSDNTQRTPTSPVILRTPSVHFEDLSGATSVMLDSENARPHSKIRVADYLEDNAERIQGVDDGHVYPPMGPLPAEEAPQRQFEHEDPVYLGILSLIEAENLIELFHQKLNVHIALLEPLLHTCHYLRTKSVVLFTTVLAAASKFYKPEVHAILLAHANTIASRAMWTAAEDAALVQSILILAYWSSPSDSSVWGKIGWAVRMGYQFHWHLPRKRPLPADRLEALQVLDAERTWICLYCFDRSHSRIFDFPPTIRPHEIGNVEGWARDHQHLPNQVDLHLACVLETQALKEHWELFVRQSRPGEPRRPYQIIMLQDMESRTTALLRKWFPEQDGPAHFVVSDEMRPKWVLLELMLAIKRYSLATSFHVELDLDQYLLICESIVEVVEVMANQDQLRVLQAIASVSTSVTSIYLKKMLPRFSRGQQGFVVDLLGRLMKANETSAGNDPECATACVARLLRRLAADIEVEYGIACDVTPACSTMEAGNGVLDGLWAELGVFTNPESSGGSVVDDTFWSQLLSSSSNPDQAMLFNALTLTAIQ